MIPANTGRRDPTLPPEILKPFPVLLAELRDKGHDKVARKRRPRCRLG